MSTTIKFISKKKKNAPTIQDWLITLPEDFIPEIYGARGLSPGEVVNCINDIKIKEGLVSMETENSDSETTVTMIFESEVFRSRYEQRGGSLGSGNIICNTNSTIIEGINTKFTSEIGPGDIVHSRLVKGGEILEVGKVATITNDSQLFLESNAKIDVANSRYGIYDKDPWGAYFFLIRTYESLYLEEVKSTID